MKCPFVAALALSFFGCGKTNSESQTRTDMGPQGNRKVSQTFAAYQKKTSHCVKPTDNAPRAIVSGFGLFSGAPYNISGVVVATMANPIFMPSTLSLEEPLSAPSSRPSSGTTSHSDFGGTAFQRTFFIDGQKLHVCFLVLDVIWDLASAVIIEETENFDPHFILMSGRGAEPSTAIFEGGALNKAAFSAGYSWDGLLDIDLTPIRKPILDDGPQEIAMAWDATFLKELTSPLLARFDEEFSFQAELEARDKNDYICNNVSYVVLNAVKGRQLSLAGGELKIQIAPRATRAGFFHFPKNASNSPEGVNGWAQIFFKTILAQIEQSGT